MNDKIIKEILTINWGLGIGDWGLGPIPNPHNIEEFMNKNIIKIIKKIQFKIKIHFSIRLE